MVATDIVALISGQVASEVGLEPESTNRIAVYTPFVYPDGDHCSFAAVRGPGADTWRLTDEGDVLIHAGYSGVDLKSEPRLARFQAATRFYGVMESNGELSFAVEESQFGDAIFGFSQACLEIIGLTKLPVERKPRIAPAFRSVARDDGGRGRYADEF